MRRNDYGAGPPEKCLDSASPALPASVFLNPPKRADLVWTKEEFLALVMHMMNGNPINHFLTVWRGDDGKPGFAKAKTHKRAPEHAKWTYDTISGKARRKTSMGLYARNADNHSTWAAIDFDHHDDSDQEVVKDQAIKAFSLMLTYRDRYVVLSASGRGYHVFVFAREPRPVGEWTALLEDVAGSIPVPIQDGQCELFPARGTEGQRTGRAIRIPGSYNPSTDSVEFIIAETIRQLLDELMSTLISDGSSPRQLIRDREVNNYSHRTKRVYQLDSSSNRIDGFLCAATSRIIEETIAKHPVTAKGTRHRVLCELIGDLNQQILD